MCHESSIISPRIVKIIKIMCGIRNILYESCENVHLFLLAIVIFLNYFYAREKNQFEMNRINIDLLKII